MSLENVVFEALLAKADYRHQDSVALSSPQQSIHGEFTSFNELCQFLPGLRGLEPKKVSTDISKSHV